MPRSEALQIARLQCSTQLASQALAIVSDPLWSTILGFVTVHELRKRDLVGPVADDILYAGIIAINTARQPALVDLAGKGLDVAAAAVAGGAGAVVASKLLPAAAGAGGAAVGGTVAKSGAIKTLGTVAKVAVPVGITAAVAWKADRYLRSKMSKADQKVWDSVPFWKRVIPIYGTAAIKKAQRKARSAANG